MFRFIVAAGVLAIAAPVMAEDWRLVRVVGESPGRTAVLIDTTSIKRADPLKPTFKTGMVFEGVLKLDAAPGSEINQLISSQRIDCAANTISILNTDAHDKAGSFLFADTSQVTEEILPGQPASVYRRAVCEQEWAPEIRAMSGKSLVVIRAELFGR